MIPDYEYAATMALETLKKYRICSAPVMSISILKQLPGVLVISFEEMSEISGIDRRDLLTICGTSHQDAVTTVKMEDGVLRYVVAYNQQLPFYLVQRVLAKELGHIILAHDGTRPEDVREAEARCFAHHLLCPRPLIHAVQATGLRFTMAVLNNLTGCNDNCISCIRKVPGVKVPAELNREILNQFKPYIINFFEYQRTASATDVSALADFGSYMEGYAE